jgi:hypothetical protein
MWKALLNLRVAQPILQNVMNPIRRPYQCSLLELWPILLHQQSSITARCPACCILQNVIAGVGSGSLESEGSAGSAGSGFSLGQRMGKLKEGLGDRMDRVRDSMRENLNREALSERMGRVKEGMREITLEGVKESLNERIDRLQEGVKEGVQVGGACVDVPH